MKLLVQLAITSVLFLGVANSFTPRDDLIGRWPLAGDAKDDSGQDRHGVHHGAARPAPGPNGRPGGATEFDGRDDWIDVPAARAPQLGSGDFSIAVWVHTAAELDDVIGDVVSQYNSERRRGFTLSIQTRSGVTSSQPNWRTVHFGIDNGHIEPDWTDHGRPGNAVLIFAFAVHAGRLYAGTCEPGGEQAGHVYQFDGGTRWIDCGSPDRSNAVSAMAVHGGQLFVGTSKYRLAGSSLPESANSHLGGGVFRHSGGAEWQDCGRLPDTEAIGGLVEYCGRLFASSLYRPAGFFRYEGGREWTRCDTPGGKRVGAMGVYDGQIFASCYDEGHVFRFDGAKWTDCGQVGDATNTQTYSFAVHAGKLFVGTWRSGRVYRYDGDGDWHDVGRLGDELEVMGMMVHNGKLYAGTLPLADVFRFDGESQWNKVGRVDRTPDVTYRRAWTMAEFQGRLFCGTLPSGRVLSIEAGKNVTHDHELAAGWRHIVAVRHADRLKLYVDGKLTAVSASFDPASYDLSTNQPLAIGFGPNDRFNGRISDLRLYRRALTEGEVATLARRPAVE